MRIEQAVKCPYGRSVGITGRFHWTIRLMTKCILSIILLLESQKGNDERIFMSENNFFHNTPPETDTEYINKIDAIAKSIKGLSQQAFWAYKPIVDDICSRKSVSVKANELEPILDGLLSVCISDEILALFKQVCRQFYNRYPEMIADYVMLYKELYENEDENDL